MPSKEESMDLEDRILHLEELAQRLRSCTQVIFVSLPEALCLLMVCNTRDDVEVRQWHNRDYLHLSCRLVRMPSYIDFKVGLITYSFYRVKPGRRRERE